jgi:hypothetical protein
MIGKVGSKSYVSMILNRKKPLTLDLARLFHKELNIPADILLSQALTSNPTKSNKKPSIAERIKSKILGLVETFINGISEAA